tara:strand:- start:32868 stop:33083 length:216 start_codon:yes stop_codon:yes gene_type:complete
MLLPKKQRLIKIIAMLLDNKISEGLLKLLKTKEVRHFNKAKDAFLDEESRELYFRQFYLAQVLELAEVKAH